MKFVLVSGGALLAASLFASSSGVAADKRSDAEEVVVTAARLEQPLSRVIGSVTVITRQEIEGRLAQSTQDLLRGETGVDIANNGGLGKLSNVFLRGADAEQVLVLVDGVRVGSATSGTTAFELLPVEQIERIEIVRGPRSSLYGSDAIGGVIQIFTRRSQGAAFSIGAGSHETSQASASFGAASGHAWFNVSANRIRSEGYNSCIGAPFPPGGGCFTVEPDRDGFENTSAALRAGYRWGDRAELEASALFAAGETEFDGSFTNEAEFDERVATLRGSLQPTRDWRMSLLVGNSRDDQENFRDDPASGGNSQRVSDFDTQKRHASLLSDLSLAGGQVLMFGVDYVQDRVDSTVAYDEASRDNIGIFSQYQAQLDRHQLLFAARYDDNEQFGGYTTGSVGWKWALPRALSLTAAWGTAFGAPTFNDLYFPGFSNPDLEPERAHSYELGLARTAGALRWSVSAFQTRIDDLIVFDASVLRPNNLEEARIRGVEAEASTALGAWTLALGCTALDPRNRSNGPNRDKFLPRRARQSGHVEIGRGFGPLDARVRVTAQGSRYDDVSNSRRLGGYATVDVVIDYALTAQWSVQGKVGNALDRDYRTVHLYNQDDRTFFVNVRYQPR